MTTAIADDSQLSTLLHIMKRLWTAVISGLIILSYIYSGWCCPLELPTVHVVVMGHDLTIELATTPETRSCGLSLRDSLPANQGMLFVYAEPEILTFWMKNTRMPLSIAFIAADALIVSIQKMNPLPLTTVYASPVPALYALEVNQGWFEENGVGVGDVVEFNLPITLNIR